MFQILSVCKGGGYQYCRTDPPHPKRNAKGLYPLHRVVAENKLGRLLQDGEVVHHRNEDKADNSPENLEVKTNAEHTRDHRPQLPMIACECECGKIFWLKPHAYRLRMQRTKGQLKCSRACAWRSQKKQPA